LKKVEKLRGWGANPSLGQGQKKLLETYFFILNILNILGKKTMKKVVIFEAGGGTMTELEIFMYIFSEKFVIKMRERNISED